MAITRAGATGARGRTRPDAPVHEMADVRGERADADKLAARTADRIVDEIAALGWPDGSVLGSEPELIERYRISRAVFREAVRLLEHQGLARMRRGPGGGLVVLSPSGDSAIDAATLYMYFVKATIDEVFEARIVIEGLIAELAPIRLGESDVPALRALLDAEGRDLVADRRLVHRTLAALTRNPALEFFSDVLNQVAHLYVEDTALEAGESVHASSQAHVAILEAVLAGDAGLSSRLMRRHLEVESDHLRARNQGTIRLPSTMSKDKRGEAVALQILGEIASHGWPVGERLGSEHELVERYAVSRAVLREAVRLLEHHQVVRMRRGPGGGLFVTSPGVTATTEAVSIYLTRRSISRRQLFEVRSAVELALVDRVCTRDDADGLQLLAASLDAERDVADDRAQFRDVAQDIHAVLADIGGNRVLELLAKVLVRLTRVKLISPPVGRGDPTGDVMRSHEGIVDAITAQDRDLARLRLRKHLDAVSEWVR